jgi:REP element-mobilizing transposase RayT
MSRPLRIHAPGYLHHVVSRGNDKECIFADEGDHEEFLRRLAEGIDLFRAQCAAYCLLSNHYHLLLVPTEFPLWRLMHRVNSGYFQYFNRRHHRVGPRVQGRYKSIVVESGAYARNAFRYVALNPVAAGVARRPEDWPWSSYRTTIGLGPRTRLLSLQHLWAAFGWSDEQIGRARFAEFVGAELSSDLSGSLLYGSERLAGAMAGELAPHLSNRDFVYPHRFAARLPLAVLLDGCKGRDRSLDAVHAAFTRHGYTLAEIADALHRDPSTISRWIKRAAVRRAEGSGQT